MVRLIVLLGRAYGRLAVVAARDTFLGDVTAVRRTEITPMSAKAPRQSLDTKLRSPLFKLSS